MVDPKGPCVMDWERCREERQLDAMPGIFERCESRVCMYVICMYGPPYASPMQETSALRVSRSSQFRKKTGCGTLCWRVEENVDGCFFLIGALRGRFVAFQKSE